MTLRNGSTWAWSASQDYRPQARWVLLFEGITLGKMPQDGQKPSIALIRHESGQDPASDAAKPIPNPHLLPNFARTIKRTIPPLHISRLFGHEHSR